MSKDFKENSISRKILMAVGETLEGLFDLGVTMIFDPHYFLKHRYCLPFPPQHFRNALRRLEKSGYLEKKQSKYYVTEKGREKIIKQILRNKKADAKKKIKWDGKWRGIIFDIPELSRQERAFLRKELKCVGFKEVQKSVWLYPYDIEKEINALLGLWKKDFEGDIRFVLIEKINDEDLKKEFNLI